MKITIPFEISEDIINNALIGAREGATSYWAKSRLFTIKGIDHGHGRIFPSPAKNGEILWNNKEYNYSFEDQSNPLTDHAFQSFFDIEEASHGPTIQSKELFVTHEAIERGLILMATKHAKHFSDLINENDDAMTHDVFLQCCLLNDVIYG